jgi:hypothetical protein
LVGIVFLGGWFACNIRESSYNSNRHGR